MLYRPSHGRVSVNGSQAAIDRDGNSVERSISNLSGVATSAPRVSSLMKPTAASALKARQPIKANHEVKKEPLQPPTP